MTESGPGPPESPMAESSDELMRWYDKHDIVSSKVFIRTPEGGVRGLFARESISSCEGIAVIPPHMIIQSQYKDLEEMVKVKTAQGKTIDMILISIQLTCRNVERHSINRPSKSCSHRYATYRESSRGNARSRSGYWNYSTRSLRSGCRIKGCVFLIEFRPWSP